MRPGNKETGESVRPAALSATQFLRLKKVEGHRKIRAGDSVVDLTHLDKVYWPDQGYTKGDLIRYYSQVSRYILKYLKDRPAILVRYPNGISEEGFYQQNVKDLPDFVKTLKLKNQAGRTLNYVIYSDLASLLYLVNLGTIAQNPWHSRTRNLDEPDYVVIDLDPHGAPFTNVLKVALVVRDVLRDLGVNGYPKTSGSSGIHVYIPISRGHDYGEAARFAERVSNRVASLAPKVATVERKIGNRKRGQVYVDWQQNARGKSAASVYSVRARPMATVSAPVTWDEIATGFELSDFTMETVPPRLKGKGDLFEGLLKDRQRLPRLDRVDRER
jgi:bifunctional non-homologous end joining protein LigD